MFPPSYRCQPSEIEKAIKFLINNPDFRTKLGYEAQVFVTTKWTGESVAKNFIRLIEGDIPKEWWLNPLSITYLYGAGQSSEKTKEYVEKLVLTYGIGSLELSNNPFLERSFLELSNIKIPDDTT